jgi:hypothetical protein
VLPEDHDELRRDRHEPDLLHGPVLESAVVLRLSRVGPQLADAGTGAVLQRRSPAVFGQLQVCHREADGFGRAYGAVVHAGERPDESTASTAIST